MAEKGMKNHRQKCSKNTLKKEDAKSEKPVKNRLVLVKMVEKPIEKSLL